MRCISCLDIDDVSVNIEDAHPIIKLEHPDSEWIIKCNVKIQTLLGELNDSFSNEVFKVKWTLSRQSSRSYLPLTVGSKVILNDEVGEGYYCLTCTIPSLQSHSPSEETCFTVIRRLSYLLAPLSYRYLSDKHNNGA